jgi:hypothetical protein
VHGCFMFLLPYILRRDLSIGLDRGGVWWIVTSPVAFISVSFEWVNVYFKATLHI